MPESRSSGATFRLEGARVAEHKHGEMDISTHEKTFEGFVKFVAWSVIIILVALVLLYGING